MTSIDKILKQKRRRSIASVLEKNNFTQKELDFYSTVNELATPETIMVKKKIQEDIDFNQFSAKQIVEESGTEFPPNPVTGQKFRKDGILYVYQRYGYSFDGINDYIDCGNDESLNITDAITIEAWVRPNIATYNTIVSKAISTTGQTTFWMDIRNLNSLYFGGYTQASDPAYIWKPFGFMNNNWYHIIGIDNGTNLELFINGSSIGSDVRATRVTGDWPVRIGARTATKNFFNGLIAEVRIYNRALSPAEIKEHYLGIFSDETGLVGNWNSSGVTPGQWIDSSGYGNHGTVYGATPCKITLPKRK